MGHHSPTGQSLSTTQVIAVDCEPSGQIVVRSPNGDNEVISNIGTISGGFSNILEFKLKFDLVKRINGLTGSVLATAVPNNRWAKKTGWACIVV